MRAFLIVLDSVGIGAAPDAADYDDAGANTLAHISQAVEDFSLPVLQKMGLGNIPSLLPSGIPLRGVPPSDRPIASYGAMMELSRGKDTTTGHWEMAGLEMKEGFRVFPGEYPSFPEELISEFERITGRKVICNHAASGTEIIKELGEQQIDEGSWIVYTSADSVFQVAANEDHIPLEELYSACETARTLCNEYNVGRVIARPYIGQPGAFKRTGNRRDYSFPLPGATILDRLYSSGIFTATIGKLDDVFNSSGITESFHNENNPDAQAVLLDLVKTRDEGFFFANLIDFDMLYGHRRDARGYARCLAETDDFLGRFVGSLNDGDLMMITADHGNDPTFKGTDHTREFVPLLSYLPGGEPRSLGIRNGFFDIAQSLASFFGIEPMERGLSFL